MIMWRQLIFPGRRHDEQPRAYHARIYLMFVRPSILGLGMLALAATATTTASVDPTFASIVILAMVAMQAPYALAARRWPRTDVVLTIALVLDTLFQLALTLTSQSPVSTATALVLPMVILGYFASCSVTISLGACLAVMLAIIGPHLEGWNDPAMIPAISFALFSVSIAIAIISARMRSTERALEQLVLEQELALSRMRQLDRSRDRLITSVSHELRTPLTSTVGAVETLLREDIEIDEVQTRDLLLIARRGGLRLLGLVEDLLTIGTTRPDALQLHAKAESLAQLVHDAIESIDWHGRPLEVAIDVDREVNVDRLRMLQVVTNLLVNAVRHGEGRITVEVTTTRTCADLRVLDEGAGVPQGAIDELFLPFARFSDRTDSSGLGLAICRSWRTC